MAEQTLDEKLKALKIQREQLEMELMEAQVKKLRADSERIKLTRKQVETEIQATEKAKKARQKACNHRKGGLGVEGLSKGEDAKYSIWKHTYVNGKMIVMCSRCQKEWKPGDPDYAEAMQFPTDNTPSGGVTFSGLNG